MHAAAQSLMSSASAGAALHRYAAASLTQASALDGLSLDSHELLRGQKAIEIKHNGAVYRLQTTKLGKLILTK